MDKMRVLVMMGGASPERNVSLASGATIANALTELGHEVLRFDPWQPERLLPDGSEAIAEEVGEQPAPRESELPPDKVIKLLQTVTDAAPDLVYIALHGGWGEDGVLQGLLDLAGIPYTGSGVLASAAAMDKHYSKQMAEQLGISMPGSQLIQRNLPLPEQLESLAFAYPLIVKPNAMGSTVGLTLVEAEDGLTAAIQLVLRELDDDALVEEYIAGSEITCTVLGDEPLPLVEIRPKTGFYDYINKYTPGKTDYLVPAPLAEETTLQIQEDAAIICRGLQVEVLARVDFRVDGGGNSYFLEVNTSPGMTATSLVPKAAAAIGIDFNQLVERIVTLSLAR